MKLIILRTDIKTKKEVKKVKSFLNAHPQIINWSVDVEDIDNVLRIESTDQLRETQLIEHIKERGFYCEDLPEYLPV
ncbi:MAG: hypothetical protein HWD85_06480 [Flavobacteriaceae bacterium]|nr:hypothetical protein [Flavobacteriaceae bacterium]